MSSRAFGVRDASTSQDPEHLQSSARNSKEYVNLREQAMTLNMIKIQDENASPLEVKTVYDLHDEMFGDHAGDT